MQLDEDRLVSVIAEHRDEVNRAVAEVMAQFYSAHGQPTTAAEVLPRIGDGVQVWTEFLAHMGSSVSREIFGKMVAGGARTGLSPEDIIESIEQTVRVIVACAHANLEPGGLRDSLERRLHSAIAIARMRVASVILEQATQDANKRSKLCIAG